MKEKTADDISKKSAADALGKISNLNTDVLIENLTASDIEYHWIKYIAHYKGRRVCPSSMVEQVKQEREKRAIHLKGNTMGDTYNINNAGIMNLNTTMNQVAQTLNQQHNDDSEVIQVTKQLTQALEEVFKKGNEQQQEKAQAVAECAKVLSEKSVPSTVLNITKIGMIDAAKTLAVLVPTLLPLAEKLAGLLLG